jgi:hypothetical protein
MHISRLAKRYINRVVCLLFGLCPCLTAQQSIKQDVDVVLRALANGRGQLSNIPAD